MPPLDSILHDIEDPAKDFLPVVSAIGDADEPARLACFARLTAMLHDGPLDRRRRGALLASSLTLPATYTASLAKALDDPDGHVRFGAASALVRQGPAAVAALDPLLLRFEDDNTPTRDRAAWAVSNIGAPAIPALLCLLDSPSIRTRALATLCVGNIIAIPRDRPNALPDDDARGLAATLLRVIAQTEPWVRLCALDAFRQLRKRFVLPALIELLESPTDHVREQASLQLSWASPDLTEPAAAALERHLNDPNSSVRTFAAEGLRRMGRRND
jgi:HEAT repeat protein